MKRQTLLRRLLIAGGAVVVLLIVILGPLLLGHFTKQKDPPQLATVEPRSFQVIASASGSLQNARLVNANFTVAGQVSAIYVAVGSKVTAGEVIARLNDTNQRAKLSAAQTAYSAANAALGAARASGSSSAILSAETAVANAYVQLVSAQQDENATSLLAPEAGSVLALNGVVGQAVSPGSQGTSTPTLGGQSANGFIVIGDPSNFVLWAPFSQTQDIQLAIGQLATITVDALPGLPLPAKVTVVQTNATPVNGVNEYLAEVTLTGTDSHLRNGQSATVNVVVNNASNVLSVPTGALFTSSTGGLQVDVWSQGQAYATNVTTGLTGNTLTQITSGLQQGEQVVISPAGAGLSATPAPSPT